MPDTMRLYRDFLAGKPGTCIFTGKDGCHAFASEDEIDATYGSRHDKQLFLWLNPERAPVGFVSDDHIDELLRLGRIALANPPDPAAFDRAALKAAFMLGAQRMRNVLALPASASGEVQPEALESLPLSLRVRLAGLVEYGPVPLSLLVEKAIPLGAAVEDAEARGRLVELSRAATGADCSDIESEAERWSEWIADLAARQARLDEITDDIVSGLTDLAHGGTMLQ